MRCTTRSRVSTLGIAVATLAACAFSDGEPWGHVDVTLAASFEVEPERLDDGRLVTSKSYLVEVERLDLTISEVSVTQRPPGEASGFDPAAPPAGYSLCHNGHCHHDSGRLVPYEEIIAELGGGPTTTTAVTLAPADPAPISLAIGAASSIALSDCDRACDLGRGNLEEARVSATIEVSGRAFDALEGDDARLSAEGRAFTVQLTEPVTFDARIDRAGFVAVGLTLNIPAGLFDAVDWEVDGDAVLMERIAATLSEKAELAATVTSTD